MRDDRENLIVKLTFDFALEIIEFSEELEEKKEIYIRPANFKGRNINRGECQGSTKRGK